MKLDSRLEKINRKDIQRVIKDDRWQVIRILMKGTSLEEKIKIFNDFLSFNEYSRNSKIQIINYINALKRSSYSKELPKYLN